LLALSAPHIVRWTPGYGYARREKTGPKARPISAQANGPHALT
jgi:hypothetical protein